MVTVISYPLVHNRLLSLYSTVLTVVPVYTSYIIIQLCTCMHATQNCAWCTQCTFLTVSPSIDDAIVGSLPLWAIIVIPLLVLLALIAAIIVVVVVVKLHLKDKLCNGESACCYPTHTCSCRGAKQLVAPVCLSVNLSNNLHLTGNTGK